MSTCWVCWPWVGLGRLAIADGLDLCVDYGEIKLSIGSIVEIKAISYFF